MSVMLNVQGIEAVIFDMNGTMINDGWYHDQAFMTFFRRHGLDIAEEEYHRRFYARKNSEVLKKLLPESSEDEIEMLSQEKEQIYQNLYAKDIREVDGLSQLIGALRAKGLKLAIATSSPPMNVGFTLDFLGLVGAFDVVTDGWQVTRSKPAPDIYLKTAEALGIAPHACLVFEDSPPGVAAAIEAGMRVIAVLSSYSSADLPRAESHITDFTDVTI